MKKKIFTLGIFGLIGICFLFIKSIFDVNKSIKELSNKLFDD